MTTYKIVNADGVCVNESEYRSIAMSLCELSAKENPGNRYRLQEPSGDFTHTALMPSVTYGDEFDKLNYPIGGDDISFGEIEPNRVTIGLPH